MSGNKGNRSTSARDGGNRPQASEREPLGADFGPAIARLRQIAAEAGDHLLLGDGPPHPDAKLLDLCAEVAQRKREVDAAAEVCRGDPCSWPGTPERVIEDQHSAARQIADRHYARKLHEAAKLPATTAQGIYAKALAIRASKTGAVVLSHSLAEDLIANPVLRMSLWAADQEATPAPAGNVVALVARSRVGGGAA